MILVLFIFAKPQNSIVGIPMAFLSLFLLLKFSGPNKSSINQKIIAWVLTSLIILISIYQGLYGQPPDIRRNNLFNTVFLNILKYSPTPLADMEELGITNPEYAEVIGYNVYHVDDFAIDLVIDFTGQVNYSDIIIYFVRHPSRLLDMINRSATSTFIMRPQNLGNFEISVDQMLSQQMDYWSEIKSKLVPGSLFSLAILFITSFCIIVMKLLKFHVTNQNKAITLLHLTIIISALGQFFLVVIGEGLTDIIKQLFLFNVLIDANLGYLYQTVVS